MSSIATLPQPYTVVLLRDFQLSELMQNGDPDTDTFISQVRAASPDEAVKEAKKQALELDTLTIGKAVMRHHQVDLEDYHFLVLFEGHITAKLCGWQDYEGKR